MSFLLLLSALLSALTGAGANDRAERTHAAVCACVEARQVGPTRSSQGGQRPAMAPLRPGSQALGLLPAAFVPAWAPLFASRRRE